MKYKKVTKDDFIYETVTLVRKITSDNGEVQRMPGSADGPSGSNSGAQPASGDAPVASSAAAAEGDARDEETGETSGGVGPHSGETALDDDGGWYEASYVPALDFDNMYKHKTFMKVNDAKVEIAQAPKGPATPESSVMCVFTGRWGVMGTGSDGRPYVYVSPAKRVPKWEQHCVVESLVWVDVCGLAYSPVFALPFLDSREHQVMASKDLCLVR